MKSNIKKSTDTSVVATVNLDAEDLAIAEQVAAKKLSKDMKITGFRKGKAPISEVIRRMDPAVLQEEAMNNAISKAVSEVFVGSDYQVIDRPNVEVKKFVPGESMEFTATVEIMPEIKLGNYKKLKVKSEKIEVSKEEVDEIVGRIRKGLAEKKDATRAAKLGDDTIIDFVGKKDGVAFDGGTGNDYSLSLGSNQFIPGFEDGIVGHSVGDEFDLNLKFPDNYGSSELAGADTVFTVKLKAIKESILPELNDEFAKKAGPFETLNDLMADIKRELTDQKNRENNEKLKESLIAQLVESSHVPVPEVLVDDQMKSIEQDFMQNLAYQGLTIDDYLKEKGFKDRDEWLKNEVRAVAEKRVKGGLVLAELSKVEKIQATDAELQDNVNKYKQQYANNENVLRQFENPEVIRDLANRLLTEKTVERLVEINKNK
ncbi:trigger factor [Candidatus Saccharibacteria bacterium]|nr:trigger factor [Candidatus Saccharibacteria bacterium]